jgi:hypothetical protein
MNIYFIIYSGLVLRIFISVWNGFWGPSFGADADAMSFHLAGVAYSKDLVLGQFEIGIIYPYFLGILYFLTIDSLFLGGLYSALIWLMSATVLIRSMRLLKIEKGYQVKAVLVYALLPSSIVMTGITLREPFQMLFVNLSIYYALKMYLDKSLLYMLLMILGLIGMSVLHGALLAFGIFIFGAAIFMLIVGARKTFSLAKIVIAGSLLMMIFLFGFTLFTSISYKLDDGLGASVELYQQNLLNTDARTTYREHVEINDLVGLLLFIPGAIFQYFFEPLPWRISSLLDAELFFENAVRGFLIWKACLNINKLDNQKRVPIIFVFACYLIVEIIWSLGTANWGTAVRHHLPGMGILLLSAFAYSVRKDPARKKLSGVNKKSSHLRI